MTGRPALLGLILTLAVMSPDPGGSPLATVDLEPSASASPGPTATASSGPTAITSPDPAQAATCQSFEIRPERCYLLGSAHITLRGGARGSVTWPLLKGVGATSDFLPSISLWYGPQSDAQMVIDLPGVPGESTTPQDGDSAGQGEAQLWWSLPGSVAGYGHACSLRYEADVDGRIAGRIRCPSERTADGGRYRVEVLFDASPVVPGPLPTPEPTPVPAPPTLTDMVCGLLNGADVDAALGLEPGSVLLLDAGTGQCAGIAGDSEVAFVAVGETATATDLVGDGTFRGAACAALPLADLGDAASAASCAWSDGPAFVVGSVLQGSTLLAISLASESLTIDELLAGVSELLALALDQIP